MSAIPLTAQRRAVVEAVHELVGRGLVIGTAGNVSIRAEDLVAVTPSGVDYAELTAELVCVVDLDGRAVHAPLAPTSEVAMHLQIHSGRAFGATAAIVHTHAPATTALSLVLDEVPTSHYYSAIFGGAVRVAPYATFGTAELADHVVTALQDRTAALISNHGAVVLGTDLDEAVRNAAYLEYVADVHLRALSTSLPVRTLDADEIGRVVERLRGYGQSPDNLPAHATGGDR